MNNKWISLRYTLNIFPFVTCNDNKLKVVTSYENDKRVIFNNSVVDPC